MKFIKQKNLNNIKENEGITLVALVITIIVLIILAGISISILLGEGGLISKSQQGAQEYKEEAKKEENVLSDVEKFIDSNYEGTVGGGSSQTVASKKTAVGQSVTPLSTTEITVLKDSNGKNVKVPAGFGIASDSANTVEDGIVIEDSQGNQFVWIPVDNIDDYTRTAYGAAIMTDLVDEGTNSKKIALNETYSDCYFVEAIPTEEYNSVNTHKGFYIGRYEAGDSTIPTAETSELRTSSSLQTNAVVIKKGYAPYNFIDHGNAKLRAEEMSTALEYGGTTKLCSSYAWDTTIHFIQSKGGSLANYGAVSPQGNFKDTTFTYTDIKGNSTTKEENTSVLVPTGQTTPVCNIYDMGGNVWDKISEIYLYWNQVTAHRGGYYDYTKDIGAGTRDGYIRGAVQEQGFRVTLFL